MPKAGDPTQALDVGYLIAFCLVEKDKLGLKDYWFSLANVPMLLTRSYLRKTGNMLVSWTIFSHHRT